MKNIILATALFALSLPAAMAYDIKQGDFCFDIVGTDANGNNLLELVKGDTELEATKSYNIQLVGPGYIVVSVGAEAMAGVEARRINFDGYKLPIERFDFKENCLKGAKLSFFPIINISGMDEDYFQINFYPGSFADISSTSARRLAVPSPATFLEGSFTGSKITELTLGGKSDIYGGAFGDELATVNIQAPTRTVCSDGTKVFPGLKTLNIDGGYSKTKAEAIAVNRLTDFTDFASHNVTINIANLFEVPYPGEDGGSSFTSTVTVPGFMADVYNADPVWQRFNINPDPNYLTDTSGKYYLRATGAEVAEIIGFNGTPDANLIIPDIIEADGVGYHPVAIYAGPFTGNSGIRSVSIPVSCNVNSRAFAYCSNLRSVKITSSTIFPGAFDYSQATELEVINGVGTLYGASIQPVFDSSISRLILGKGCVSMQLPDALAPGAVIESYAVTPPLLAEQNPEVFSTAKVTVPNGSLAAYKKADVWKDFTDMTERPYDGSSFSAEPFLVRVVDLAARKCALAQLTGASEDSHLSIPATVTAPDGTVFTPVTLSYGLLQGSPYTEVDIKAPIDTIGAYAFSQMANIRKIEIPNTVTQIYANAFQDCTGLTEVKLPENIETLESGLFAGCMAIEEINIPSNVTELKSEVFFDCKKLSSVTIPAGVEKIGSGCISGTNLSTFELAPSATPLKAHHMFLQNMTRTNIECIRVGRDVTLYTSYDFDENSIVTDYGAQLNPERPVSRIELGADVTDFTWFPIYRGEEYTPTVADNAVMVSEATVPPVLGSCSQAQFEGMTVFVPENSLEAYRNADVWKNFISITGMSGIDKVTATPDAAPDAPVYDLTGRRVADSLGNSRLAPGIYIQSGRKIIVR